MPKVKFKARTTAEIENLDIENGSLIYNTENGKTYLDYDNERISTGGGAGGGVATGDTPPENPEENDLWIDTDDDENLAQVDATVSTTSTNAIQNQAITNYVNKVGGIILWTNSNPSSSMADGTQLELSSSDYTFYELISVLSNSSENIKIATTSGRVPKGKDFVFYTYAGLENGSSLQYRWRTATYVNDTKLTISGGQYKNANGTSNTANNNILIPIYVIGYKI